MMAPANKLKKVKKPHRPKYEKMIIVAVTAMNDEYGSSFDAINDYIIDTYKVDPMKSPAAVETNLLQMTNRGYLCSDWFGDCIFFKLGKRKLRTWRTRKKKLPLVTKDE